MSGEQPLVTVEWRKVVGHRVVVWRDGLGMGMSSAEARELAQYLVEAADEADEAAAFVEARSGEMMRRLRNGGAS